MAAEKLANGETHRNLSGMDETLSGNEPSDTAGAQRGPFGLPLELPVDALIERATVPAGELRERLLSFLVHEVRNPLASALWSAEMLARRSLNEPRADRLSHLAVRSVRRLRALLEDLFALERLPEVLPRGVTSLGAALARAVGPHDLEPRGIEARVEVAEEVRVPLDPVLLDRMLHACARRAARVGQGGPLLLTAERAGGQIKVALFREGVTRAQVDPAPLTPGGSDGEGTTFALLVARAIAQRLGVALSVGERAGGVAIELLLPVSG